MASPVMELFAKIGLDSKDFEKGLDESKGKLSKFGSSLGGAVGKVGSAALKTSAVALGAATTGVIALTKSAYSAYSEYQQLQGGIETLYKDSSDQMMKYAENAYKTAGMSKNQYMEIAIESSAAMINSLGGDTEKAAEMTDLAIRDMSDNMNKMGTDMESLQNAYRGFSRGNFTMLDNLALGFSGTKQGMEELLAKAEELSGVKYDISSYADIVEAIHVVQSEMGITGTTALEASETISGSFNSLKGAWQNLVTGLADPNADIGALISDVVETGSAALENMIPTIEQALVGIGQLIKNIVPIIGEKLPGLIEQVLPGLLSAATSLVNSLASALPGLVQILVDQIPVVLPQLIQAATTLVSAIGSQLPEIITIISDVLIQELPKLIDNLQKNISKISAGLKKIFVAIGNMIVKLAPVMIPAIFEIGLQLIQELANAMIEHGDDIVGAIIEILDLIITTLTNPEFFGNLLIAAGDIIVGLGAGLIEHLPDLLVALGKLLEFIVEFLFGAAPELGKSALEFFKNIGQGLLDAFDYIGEKLGDLIDYILGGISDWWNDLIDGAKAVFGAIGDGLLAAWDTITSAVSEFGELVWGGIEDVFSGVWEYGKKLGNKIWEGIKSTWKKLKDALNPKNWGADFDAEGITSKLYVQMGYSEDTLNEAARISKEQGKEAAKAYLEGQKEGFDIHSPSKKMAYIGRMVMKGFSEGIEDQGDDSFKKINDVMEDGFSDVNIAPVSVDETASLGLQSKESETSLQNQRIDKLIEMLGQYMGQDNTIIVPVHIGDQQIDEMVVDAKNRVAFRSGGQVNA